jgi:hypothetical protein
LFSTYSKNWTGWPEGLFKEKDNLRCSPYVFQGRTVVPAGPEDWLCPGPECAADGQLYLVNKVRRAKTAGDTRGWMEG